MTEPATHAPIPPPQPKRTAGYWLTTRYAIPVAASVLTHSAIALVLVVSGWGSATSRPGGFSKTEVYITLPNPPASPPPVQGQVDRTFVPTAAAPAGALPTLQGLSTPTLGGVPELRSTAGDWSAAGIAGAAEALKRQDEVGLGATFAGLGTKRAANVVYVVDASGAMVTSLRFVLEELNRSVSRLSSGQKFAVVLYRERSDPKLPPYEVFSTTGSDPGDAMIPATPANKTALRRWLAGVRPMGRSNPLEGLRRGLAFPGDAVFLLSRSIRRSGGSDGAGADGGVWGRRTADIMAELDRLNPIDPRGQRRVVIKAIQFLEEDPTGTMQAIGNAHGDGPGSYTVLPLEALAKP